MRYFTPQEVNELLPRVKEMLSLLMARWEALQQLQRDMMRSSSLLELMERRLLLDRTMVEYWGALESLEALGCMVKDLEQGLVDFPALRRGEEVWLCWRLGERECSFWHKPHDGFRGRRPIRAEEFSNYP